MKQENKKMLSAWNIGVLYVGCLMGAGFASGKEMWQFFGVFGLSGLRGICLITLIFMGFGYMTIHIGKALNSGDLSKIIFPADNKVLENIIGGLMSLFLLMAYFSMLAAGSAIFEEQFGVNRALGGFCLMLLVVFTTVGGFELVADRLKKATPVLLLGTFLLCFVLIYRDYGQLGAPQEIAASPLTGNWVMASLSFVSYNLMGGIPMLGSCSIYAESERAGKLGAALGGVFLGVCSTILFLTGLTDPHLAHESALPMLALCGKISGPVQLVYSGMLLIAVFSTATSTFYGFTTKLPEHKYRRRIMWATAALGYGLSLFGFSNIVAVVYPIGGYCGLIFLVSMIINFIRIKQGKRNVCKQESDELPPAQEETQHS